MFVIPNLLLLIFKFSSRYWRFRCFASSCFFFIIIVVHTLVFNKPWGFNVLQVLMTFFFVCSSSIFKFSSNFWRFQYFVNLMIYFYLLSLMCHCPFVHCQFSIFLKFWCYVGIYSFLSVFVTLVSIIKFLILWRSWCFVGFYYYVYYLPLCLLN